MPARTPSTTTTTNSKGRRAAANQSRASNTSGDGDGESGAEKPEASKFQTVPIMSTSSNAPSSDRQNNVGKGSTFVNRRRQSSIPSAKAPIGPRPLDISAGKRSVSNNVPGQFSTISGASAVASQDPYTHQLSINDISRFSFASIAPQKPTPPEEQSDPLGFGDFLTPINFDDFHNSIIGTGPSLSHFPLPGRGGAKQGEEVEEKEPGSQPSLPILSSRKSSVPASIVRKGSNASNANRISAKPDFTSTTGGPVLKGRRQSQFPPNAFNNTNTKAPRKSIGPGTFVAPETPENSAHTRKPSIGGRKSSAEKQRDTAVSVRLVSRGSNQATSKDMRATASPRAAKAKSLLDPTSQSSDLLTPSRTPDHSRSSSTNAALTPNRSARSGTPGRTGTPGAVSTGNRRISMMPAHAKGLGARTISPTDARRMKRMSTMPPAPPLPQTRLSQAPPTPQPEITLLGPLSTAQSPIPTTRKSITPSSSRTTPDPNRKSYSSGQSLSSATSYGSVRNSTILNQRHSQIGPSSRLPTLKPRLDTSAQPINEEVPPVPAIPKAYESPQSEIDLPFFSARSSSLPPFDTPILESPSLPGLADAMNALETPRAPSSSSRKSGMFNFETEPRSKPQPNPVGRKNLHSVRLPPLNLLPLSTPTTTKVKALKESKIPTEERPITPPARRNNVKTPSTPMTASKASFFSRSNKQTEDSHSMFVRSNTSHNVLRFGTDDQRPPSSSSPNLPPFAFEGASNNTRNISPFISSSLPKSSGEFASYMRPNFGSEFGRTAPQARPSGPRAPSFSVTPKAELKESPIEQESTFSAATLRRKLSRKRSESRTREPNESEIDVSKYDNMPPPKLPASATWEGITGKGSSPTQKPSYLKSRRKTSSSSINMPRDPERQSSFSSIRSFATEGRPSMESTHSWTLQSTRSGSFLANAQNLVTHRSNVQLHSSDSSLDRDDMAAEEEMKKLASKRKDFESAARELDTLRKRARPVDRMSPGFALQTVNLNIFERGEIVDYSDIYFTGTRNAKKIVGDLKAETSNFGYDDERGDYNIIEGDHLNYRYEVVDLLGKGSFGQVVRCVDHKTGILVAVKIIRNKKRFHQQALVEVNILKKLREWDPSNKHSVVNFDQSFYFRGHLCISTDLLGMNLYEFIKAHDFRGFSLKLIRRFTKQMLSSLLLLHSHKVIHCDLKPENILLAHPIHSEIKVIDFGSSCFENEKVYTYIQSRFYRSPEVILGMSYGMPIDMWSLGCILAELFTGYPIFPGENEQEQLACIMEVFGPPEKHLIEKSSRKKLFFDSMGKPRLTVSSKGRRRRPSSKELRQVLKCDDEAFLDFITRCLRWDPARRMNPHEANMHEFITGVKLNSNATRRHVATGTASPIKRVNSVTANGGVRPLPQPPATSLKNGVAVRQDSVTSSPNRRAPRQSIVNGFQAGAGTAKRASHAAMSASSSATNLSRVTMGQRSAGGRPDLATAAAAASLVR